MHAPLPLAASLALVVVSALLFGMSFPPWGFPGFAYVALIPLLLALRSAGPWRSVGLACLWGSLWCWVVAGALPASIARYTDQPLWVGTVFAFAVFTAMSTAYYMLFAVLDWRIARRPRAWTPLLVASAWVIAEWGRCELFTGSHVFIGNPWGLLGYTHPSGSLAQIASVTGVYGISFVLVAFNAGIAQALASRLARGSPPAPVRSRAVLVAAAVPLVVVALAGGAMLRAAPPTDRAGDFREVGVVQAHIPLARTWDRAQHGANLERYLALTGRVAGRETLRTLVWPESALNFFLESEDGLRARIARSQGEADLELLVGGPRAQGRATSTYFNSMFLLDADGTLRATYDKEVLVPFFEFQPFAAVDVIRRAFDGPRTFAHGRGDPPPLDTRLGRVGLLVCGEAMLPSVARDRVLAGAEVLISPSNDGWIEDDDFAEHMLLVTGLRAIEQRRFLVRASTSGPSAVIDPWGRPLVKTAAFQREVLVGRVEPLQKLSKYNHLGDSFAFGCGTLALLATIGRPRGKRRTHR